MSVFTTAPRPTVTNPTKLRDKIARASSTLPQSWTDQAIGTYSALNMDSGALNRDFSVDSVVSQLEQAIVREYEKGGTVASMKTVVDNTLDRLHRGTSPKS